MRSLIVNDQYDVGWTRVRTSISPQGLAGGALPAAPSASALAAYPLINTSSPAAGSSASPYTRKTFTTPLALQTVVAAAVNPTPGQTYVCAAQALRKMLTIQNNSQATPTDTAPTLYIGLGQPATAGQSAFAIAPGAGIAFEVNPPQEEIFIAWGAYSNAGGTAVIQGAITQSIVIAQPTSTTVQ
jgi:hypothetical protein